MIRFWAIGKKTGSGNRTAVLLVFLVYYAYTHCQVPAPAADQEKSVLLLNGTLHVGNGVVIERAAVGFRDGKIIFAGQAAETVSGEIAYDEKIDVSGKHIYPGFIAPNSILGLTEIDLVRATADYREVGEINPNARAVSAYNADSRIIPTVRSNGVLMAQATPRGGMVSGTSSVVELDAWNWEDAVYKPDEGVHVNWPGMYVNTGWWAEPGKINKSEKHFEQTEKLKQFFRDAAAYSQIKAPEEKDLRLEALRGLFDGRRTLYIHANYIKEILESVSFAKEIGVPHLVLVGGYDAWMATGFLADNHVPVILCRVHSLPLRSDDDIEMPYELPFLLQKAGVLFCLDVEGDMEAMNTRNLPFYAGTAVAYGLTEEEALSSITLNAARILYIDKTVGSIETGKDATLIVSSGNVLDMRTNNIEYAFIRGRQIDLDNHQKVLYRKYKAKYERGKR